MVCLLTFHAVAAKSEATSPESFNKSSNLILDLPTDEFLSPVERNGNTAIIPNPQSFSQKRQENQQIIASDKKKTPLNVDCGMDLYQNTAPEVSMTSRLTGECDFKYHY